MSRLALITRGPSASSDMTRFKHSGPAVVGEVRRQWYRRIEVVGGNRRSWLQGERHDPGPVRQLDVFRVVEGPAGAHLGGDLDEVEGHHGGRREFAGAGR